MSQADTARIFYTSARTELVERMRLRDNTLVFYLAAVGAIFGVALGPAKNPDLLMLLPFLSLGAGIVISQHFALMGSLAAYCALEIGPFLRDLSPAEDAPQWDDSAGLREFQRAAIHMRSVSHVVLIVLPAVVALFVTWGRWLPNNWYLAVVWWAGIAASIWTLVVVWTAHRFRRRLYKGFQWREFHKDMPVSPK